MSSDIVQSKEGEYHMRKIMFVAAALGVALAGCNGAGGAAGEDSAKASKTEKADASDKDEAETESKPTKKPASAGGGKWDIDTHECSAMAESGDSAIKIQQTDSDLKIFFAPDWAADVDEGGELTVSGEPMAFEKTDGQGHDWLVVTSPNDEPGGVRDIIANAQTLKLSYSGSDGKRTQAFSLKGSNGVMDKLLKCAGL